MGRIHREKSSVDKRTIPRARIAFCIVCGAEFRAVKDFKERKQKICSKKCWSKRARTINKCLCCLKEIITTKSVDKKYCDQKCRDFHYRERLKGQNSHFWKGGKTAQMQLIKTSAQYREWRLAVFTRDKFTCVVCGASKVYVEADHIKPKSQFPELMFDVGNGRTLCKPCHRKTETFGKKATKL